MKRFLKLKKNRYRKSLNERNDCGVVAISIAGRCTYKVAHAMLKQEGRTNRHGSQTWQIQNALYSLGFRLEKVNKLTQKSGSLFTPKTIGNRLKRGYYICFVNRHVMAIVNGEVEDWTSARRHRITLAYKIVRTRK